MTISELSIRKPVFAWMLMASMLLFGGIAFQRMGVSQMPDVDFPVVNVGLVLEGASPEVMERTVVEPVEDALMQIAGIKSLSSSSKTGTASVSLEFALEKNIDVAVQEVQTVLAQALRRLPEEVEYPTVRKTNPEDHPILWLGVRSDTLSQKDLMVFVRDRVKDKFSTLPGVGEVFLGGYVEPNLRVTVSREKMDALDLTITDVMQAIQSEHSELPAGRIETTDKEFNVRSFGEAPDPESFAKLPILRRGGGPNFRPIPLSEVATVEDGLDDVRRLSRSQGKTAIGLGIKKQRGTNAVAVGQAVKERMRELAKDLPSGTELAINFDSTQFIEEAVHELNFTLILSAILTALVCWMFLGSWSATVNVILAIPVSVVGTFVVLYAMGFTLNLFTLLGLSLAIGIVVDDAIMVLENIVRHREMGKSRPIAAVDGAVEITFSAIAATAAIIAIFLPVAFMEGIIGKYFFEFGVTLSVSVLISLLEALTLAPMRCAQFLEMGGRTTRIGKAVDATFEKLSEWYSHALGVALRHRIKVILVAVVIFASSMLVTKLLRKEFVPPQDQSRLMLRIQAPMGSSLEYTDTRFREVEQRISSRPEVERYYAAVGGFGGGGVDSGMIFVTLKPRTERPTDPKVGRPLSQQEFADVLRADLKQFKDLRVVIQDPSLSGFSAKRGFPVEFTVRGPDWDTLVELTKSIMKGMEETGTVNDVDSDYQEGPLEVRVVPNRAKAQARGVSVATINEVINASIGGVPVGKFSKGSRRYDVRIRLQPSERSKTDDILALSVRNNRGERVSLRDLVTIERKPSLQAIAHQDRERAISVFANVASSSNQQAAIEGAQTVAKKVLPEGYRVALGGSSQSFGEAFTALTFALLLGIAVAYMVLAAQFNSFLDPVIVLLALPFSLTGAFLSLWIGGQSLNLYSFIGILLLMGLVKKNSILLVDFTNKQRDEGDSIDGALSKACPQRLRPILMTTVATIAAAVPPALAVGPGAESRIPMALVVIGGTAASTFLTLFVVPAAYSLTARKRRESQLA